MASISLELIKTYRQETFRLQLGKRLNSADEAVEYVNERGFIFLCRSRTSPCPVCGQQLQGIDRWQTSTTTPDT
jgi:hypothetical protein